MARKRTAGPGKKTRPETKNSPAVTPRRRPVRKIELEAAPRPLELSNQSGSYPIVGVGASAGGFEAFRELLKALPSDSGLALVLVQHLDPGHESLLAKLLSHATAMPVREVEEGMAVEPNHVYVIPPNKTMGIRNGTLHLIARGEPAAKHLPVDYFLTSLAEDRGNRAVGVILSGTASDGTLGLKAIKAEGGITFAQDSQSAKYCLLYTSPTRCSSDASAPRDEAKARTPCKHERFVRPRPGQNPPTIRRMLSSVPKCAGGGALSLDWDGPAFRLPSPRP